MVTGDLFLDSHYQAALDGPVGVPVLGPTRSEMPLRLTRGVGPPSAAILRLDHVADGVMTGELLEAGQPARPVHAQRHGWELRTLDLKVAHFQPVEHRATGLDRATPARFRKKQENLPDIFLAHGVRLDVDATAPDIPWVGNQVNLGELHQQMTGAWVEASRPEAWKAYLLVAPRLSMSPAAFGVMFDGGDFDDNGAPRQGCAVFSNAIPWDTNGASLLMLRTMAHELGHVLNLPHPIGGNANDTLMTDTLAALDDAGTADRMRFFFSPTEARHLRHARFPDIAIAQRLAIGGDIFDLPDANARRRRVRAGGEEQLVLRLEVGANRIAPCDPLHVRVQLQNRSSRARRLPALNPLGGYLQLAISPRGGPLRRIRPPVRVCAAAGEMRIAAGESLVETITLLVDAEGPLFTRAGEYALHASLRLGRGARERRLHARPANFVIREPKERELKALKLLRNRSLAAYIACGGADHLEPAAAALQDHAADANLRRLNSFLDLLASERLARPYEQPQIGRRRERALEPAFERLESAERQAPDEVVARAALRRQRARLREQRR